MSAPRLPQAIADHRAAERRGGAQRGERGAVAAEREHEVARADFAARRDLLLLARRAQLDHLGALPLRPLANGGEGVAQLTPRVHDEADAVERVRRHRPATVPLSTAMCFAFDASPPDLPADIAPIAGGAGAELLELESADGTRFSAALAESPEPRGRAVVILPDVRGLYPFYSELAERFAAAGHHAIALDYFGRTAGLGPRGEDFEYMPHVQKTRPRTVQEDAAAALAALRERTGAGAASTRRLLLRRHAVVPRGDERGARPRGRDRLLRLAEPGALGRHVADPPRRRHARARAGAVRRRRRGHPARPGRGVRHSLAEAGVEHEIVTYPGAPHSFFDRRYEEHAEACADAWRRILAFL